MSEATTLEDVVKRRAAVKAGRSTIPRATLLAWMAIDDIEILGAVYHTIADPTYTARVEPPLLREHYHAFVKKYLGRCLVEDPKGEWATSRYSAGWDLVNWIVSFWNDGGRTQEAIDPWKEWLSDLYRRGDSELRSCLVTATLEHLFEQRGMRTLFSDWKRDPDLAGAYEKSAEWVREGGTSPLGKKRRGTKR